MGLLKEYAGVIAGVVVAVVTVITALGALGLWAIEAQVTPEIARLEGRIDRHEVLLRQIDRKIDTNLKVIDARFDRMDDRFNRVNDRFDLVNDRFDRCRGRDRHHPQRHQDHSIEASKAGRVGIARESFLSAPSLRP